MSADQYPQNAIHHLPPIAFTTIQNKYDFNIFPHINNLQTSPSPHALESAHSRDTFRS
jgi:hypothetical protein